MSRPGVVPAAFVLLSLLSPACAIGRETAGVSAAGDRSGLSLDVELHRVGRSFFVLTTVQNMRTEVVHLDADQCGRVTEVVLARTAFEPEGNTYAGSLGKVKELVLDRQRFAQNPNGFHPRRVTGGRGVPECVRPVKPVTVASGATVEERWELPFDFAYGLQEVGSAHTVVRAEVVEAEAPDSLSFLDVLALGEAEELRKGRALRVELPASKVLHLDERAGDKTLSLGQRFDRMVEDDALRTFISAQPVDSWRHADLLATDEQLAFSAVTTEYERALSATVSDDGARMEDLQLPGDGDRTRVFERRRATLPPAVALVPGEDDYVISDDLTADWLVLPSGRVAADAYFTGETEPIAYRTEPGSYPVHVTLARYPGSEYDDVALASLVVSGAPTVEWEEVSGIAVDGGSAAFTSAEGAEAFGRLLTVDEAAWFSIQEVASDSLTAHEHLVTESPIDADLNLVMFTTGLGDGGYPVFVGLDGAGRPTRFVIDFGLLHLDWQAP